jgi:hypothetical protein
MSHVAYGLRAPYEDTYAGGSICVGANGEAMDILAELEKGNGVIVVPETNTYALTALDAYPPLKRVAVPKKQAAKPAAAKSDDVKKEG